MVDPVFTNGVIAVKERLLLGDKLLRFSEMTAEEVFRALRESGFGGTEAEDGESMCRAEEAVLDSFIREYSPSQTEATYLLAPRDFHNAKALCKAHILGTDAEKMLAPEGLISIDRLSAAISGGKPEDLPRELRNPVERALSDDIRITGAEIGAVFGNALNKYLSKACRFNRLLVKLLAGRADRTNILTAVRAGDKELAEKLYVCGGKLKNEDLAPLFDDQTKGGALSGTPYFEFYKLCESAAEKGLPLTAAERSLESFEAEYFAARKYELEGKQPFLYYVFRRRAEIQNVRIILVCLNAGMPAQEIKKRLRAV